MLAKPNLNTIIELKKQLKNEQIMLLPDLDCPSESVLLSVSNVQLIGKKNPEDRTQDYWSPNGFDYFLTKSALRRIAKSAGLRIIDSILINRQIGADLRVVYANMSIKYQYLKINGDEHQSSALGEYSYYEDLKNIMILENGSDLDPSPQRKSSPNHELIESRRRFSSSVAEGNALKKALCEIYPRLQKPFRIDELINPFIVIKVVYNKEKALKDNPEFRSAYINKILGLGESMFGILPAAKSRSFNS